MDRIVVAVAIGTALVFGTGVMAGVIAMVVMAIRREDRLRSLTRQPRHHPARRRGSTAMSDATAVIGIVLFVFFLVGVTVGIIVVIAVPARRAGTAARRAHPVRPPGVRSHISGAGTGVPERKLAPIFAAGSQSPGRLDSAFPGSAVEAVLRRVTLSSPTTSGEWVSADVVGVHKAWNSNGCGEPPTVF